MAVVMVIHLEGAVKTKEGIWCLQQVFKFGKEGAGGIYIHAPPPAQSANTPLQDGTKMEEQVKSCRFTKQNDVIFATKKIIFFFKIPILKRNCNI